MTRNSIRIVNTASVMLLFACSNGQHRSTEPAPGRTSNPLFPVSTESLPAAAGSPTTFTPPEPVADAAIPEGQRKAQEASGAAPDFEEQPVPTLVDQDGKALQQTDQLPSFDSPSFRKRVELLFEAIVKDDPAIATPSFFPLVAYEQVKAISQPARDHKFRLLSAFARNIHEYHRLLGSEPTLVKLLGIEPSHVAPRWMTPGSEGNRLGYYRMLRARLRIADKEGKERPLEITSMISWRGEWYVVHLNGFK